MKGLERKVSMLLVCSLIITLFTVQSKVHAANYSSDAMALGFELDKDYYKNIGWVNEKSVSATFKDDAGNTKKCGVLTSQTLYATNKTPYLINYQQDAWLTRSYTEPLKVTCKLISWLSFKFNETVQFSVSSVVEDESMPTNIKLAEYMATSESMVITKSVTSGWGISGSSSLKCKNVEVGLDSGVSWSSSSDKILCTAYNASRTNRFKVTFDILDPYYNTMTSKQKSYCNNLNYYYTAKYVYGTPTTMKRYTAPTYVTAEFIGHYRYAGLDAVTTRNLSGTAKYTVNAAIGG